MLTEKGYVDPEALDRIVEAYETRIGPHIGARVVARAGQTRPSSRRCSPTRVEAIETLGLEQKVGDHLIAVENTSSTHNMIVCTLCSCYPWDVLGLPPAWYKSTPYRARTVKEPRAVLADFGVTLPADKTIRVWDRRRRRASSCCRCDPKSTEGWSEERLASLVTRDSMIGTGLAKTANEAGA